MVGDSLENMTFQTNLYGTLKGKNLLVSKEEIMAFIGIHFLMGYHTVPQLSDYWSTSDDLRVPDNSPHLHINDNSLIPRNNKDKLYTIRPLLRSLNNVFLQHKGAQRMSVDESIVKFKGRH